jgi:arylsulfatase
LSGSRRLGLGLLILLAACAGEPSTPPPPAGVAGKLDTAPSIVIVTIDTLRADHVHAYGYHRQTTPHLDALAAEGVLFERAFATMATTLPSHVSLFSGVYAHQHGITQNVAGRQAFDAAGALRSAAQLLRDDGYITAAFVSAAPVKRVTGVGAGFDLYEEPKRNRTKGARTPDLAIEWLERAPAEPFLLWVHLWDPHEPNRPSAAWQTAFASDAGLDAVIDQRAIDPARLRLEFDGPALRRFLSASNSSSDSAVDRDAVRDMLNRYDADVAVADREVGRIVETLRRRGVLDRAIVVVTADHGQSLGQHDWLPHGRTTNDNLQVPLIMRFPPGVVRAPLRVGRVVSLVDALPTVLSRFDGEASRRFLEQAAGEDALAGGPGRGWALAQRTGRERAGWQAGGEYALVTDRWKLVRRAGGAEELYDLAADPGELDDVSGSHPDVMAALGRALDEVVESRTSPPAEAGDAVPEEQIEALRSLGYVDD